MDAILLHGQFDASTSNFIGTEQMDVSPKNGAADAPELPWRTERISSKFEIVDWIRQAESTPASTAFSPVTAAPS